MLYKWFFLIVAGPLWWPCKRVVESPLFKIINCWLYRHLRNLNLDLVFLCHSGYAWTLKFAWNIYLDWDSTRRKASKLSICIATWCEVAEHYSHFYYWYVKTESNPRCNFVDIEGFCFLFRGRRRLMREVVSQKCVLGPITILHDDIAQGTPMKYIFNVHRAIDLGA